MRIAVDAMGGDYAPAEIVNGAVEAAVKDGIEIVLVGQKEKVEAELRKYSYPPEKIAVFHAPGVIDMNEHPASAVRHKKDSSIVIATKLVKDGVASAVVSAGNTGAQMAASIFILGRVSGIDRPGIATVFPSPKGPKVLLDSGANVDVKSRNLIQFAHLGSLYSRNVLGVERPRVALLNVGSEPNKGTEVVQEAYRELAQDKEINFSGNIEGREFLTADVDVIICDGFVGNVVLKLTEGLVTTMMKMVKEELKRNPLRLLGGVLVKPGFRDLFRKLDYTEYGGAPLLGIMGISIICHGSSKAKAIRNAIRFAQETAQSGFMESLKKGSIGDHHA
ncbi:MAG TPA: phosphate acyltransferase PlsX [Syntrophomonadaceae bacterium]|nr:phosphate acyltransferase PlsX [Syntrophomonadaceae bacterium]